MDGSLKEGKHVNHRPVRSILPRFLPINYNSRLFQTDGKHKSSHSNIMSTKEIKSYQ